MKVAVLHALILANSN